MAHSERSINQAWVVLAGVGFMLVVAGGVDLALGIYPLHFGTPAWELGAVGNLLNRLPMFVLGLTLLVGSSLAERRAGWSLFWAAVLLLMGILVFVLALFVATSVPLILAMAPGGVQRFLVIKSIAKIAGQTIIYFPAFCGVAIYAIRSSRRLKAR